MKKVLCFVLCLIIALSCCTVLTGFAAEDQDQNTATAYLLGDVDLDGEVTVFDATLIQRSLVSLDQLSELQKKLGDVDADGELTVFDATAIQRNLVSIPDDFGIGEAAGDPDEGVVYAESLTWYQPNPANGDIVEEKQPVYFSTAYPDVPFISDKLAVEVFLANYLYTPRCEAQVSKTGLVHRFELPMGTYVDFDYDQKVMYFSDYTSTLVPNGAYPYNPFFPMAKYENKMVKVAESDKFYGGDPVVATFAYDEVPMLKSGDQILIPLQAMTDLFLSYTGVFYQYNGTGVFTVNEGIKATPSMADYWNQYQNTAKKTDTISAELAQVNYYSLCNVLDARYGLQDAHNIASFDAFFARKGLKKRMLSTDVATIEKAQQDISRLLFEDFHSGSGLQSIFLSEEVKTDTTPSPVYLNRYAKMNKIKAARTAKLGETLGVDFPQYQRVGDTVFITFDAFTFMDTSGDIYYTEAYTPTADGNTSDTVDLFHYALQQLSTVDKDAKNVVVDISCNGGGAIYGCAYAMQAICGQSMVVVSNPNTWALHQCVLNWDLNLDGVIDENDKSMLEMGFNVAILMSDCSFSCGNLLPNTLNMLDDRILFLGQQSGGGSCAVGSISTAIGSTMSISSEARLSTMKNGYIRDIDDGLVPDIYLTADRMFDREYIVELLDTQFAVPAAPAYTEKSVPVLRSSVESTETAALRVYEDQPNVPYMGVKEFYDQFYLFNTDLKEGMTCTYSDGKYTLTNIAGNTAVFDVNADTIYVDNYESFATGAYAIQVGMTGGVDENHPFIKLSEVNEPAQATPMTISLGEYGIDLRGDEAGVYAPLATLSDFFATAETYRVVYSGKKIYTADFTGVYVPTPAIKSDPDYLTDVEADHPADLADFTYRELCFNIDLWYGQPGQEWVHDDLQTMKLDELLTAKYPEIKEKLLATDFATYYTGLVNLINGILYDGGHTTVEVSPVVSGDLDLTIAAIKSMMNEGYAQKYIATQLTKPAQTATRTATRDAAYGDDYYLELGDTAMIHFDSFVTDSEGWKAFYAGSGDRPLKFTQGGKEVYDTVGVVLSGLERAKQNPAIKNIIIDMSCNGGGDEGAMVAIDWLMTGQGYTMYQDRLTGCKKTSGVQFDMNFDGVFDENDVSPYTGYNYGVLTSSYAFSCGNAYPWFMHTHGAMILGQKSSGGACAIRISSAAGVEFASSAASSHVLSDTGENVDFGCPVDADLTVEGENPYANFYNLELLSRKMNEFFTSN